MLCYFFVRNFRSIVELRLDLAYGEGKAPNGYRSEEVIPFVDGGRGERLVPCLALFGANASGKTNILKALLALKRLVTDGVALSETYEPNLLHPELVGTTLGAGFQIRGESFEYRVVHSATEIMEETLLKNGRPLCSIRGLKMELATHLVSAAYSRERLSEILRVECSDGDGRQTKPFLHRLGLGYRGLHPDFKGAFEFFNERLRYCSNQAQVPLPASVEILASTLDCDRKAALCEITEVVRRMDVDIAGIDIVVREMTANEVAHGAGLVSVDQRTGAKHAFQISVIHSDASGNPAVLDFLKHESAGTQRLAGLVGLILYTLRTGGVLVVDELECSLHPLLMCEIVAMFKRRRHNPKGAQLIVTTHNTDILDDSILRLSEIGLVKKTPANGTMLRRLVDAKNEGEDIRNVTNFRKQYLAGFYSGIPHPAV